MAFQVQSVAAEIADATLVWCGVTDPTPAEITVAELAATTAVDAIRHYRGLDTAPARTADTEYVLDDVVQPLHENEHLYKCSTAGTTDDDVEPTWPTTAGATVTDGTVVWTEYVRPFEEKYRSLAVEIAVYLYQKRGADGATAFGENGVQRSFEKGSIPPSMLSRIGLPVRTG